MDQNTEKKSCKAEDHFENAAVVTFNNQNSILMAMYLKLPGILCLLHDNRIFAFKKRNDDSSSTEEQNLILSLLTTAKFRLMGFLYSGYHLVDNTLFLLIVVLSIINNGLTIPEHHQLALFAAIGLEGFYDIMLYTHRYWILQRLSIYIGIVLYVAYFVIVGLMTANGHVEESIPNIPLHVVWIVLGTRFGAFCLQELVDIAIDMQLHNDLVKLNQERIDRSNTVARHDQRGDGGEDGVGSTQELVIAENPQKFWNTVKKYLNVSNAVQMPQEVVFMGSLFAWSQRSVFDMDVWKVDKFSELFSICLCVLPSIPAFLVLVPMLILCCAAGVFVFTLLLITAILTGNWRVFWTRSYYWLELLRI